jgi:predicted lipid-binding transport protein (Tim44 family)
MEAIGAIIGFCIVAFLVLMVIGWVMSLFDPDTDTAEPEPYDPITAARNHTESAIAQARADAQKQVDAAAQAERQRAAEALRRARQAQQSETGWE